MKSVSLMCSGFWFWSQEEVSSERCLFEHVRRSDNGTAGSQWCRQDHHVVNTDWLVKHWSPSHSTMMVILR